MTIYRYEFWKSFILKDNLLLDTIKHKSNAVPDPESIIVVNDELDYFYSSPKAVTEHVININSGNVYVLSYIP